MSMRSTLHSVDRYVDSDDWSKLHVYEDCMDTDGNIQIESIIRDEDGTYSEILVVKKEDWDKLVVEILKSKGS